MAGIVRFSQVCRYVQKKERRDSRAPNYEYISNGCPSVTTLSRNLRDSHVSFPPENQVRIETIAAPVLAFEDRVTFDRIPHASHELFLERPPYAHGELTKVLFRDRQCRRDGPCRGIAI